jgi:signal peptidase
MRRRAATATRAGLGLAWLALVAGVVVLSLTSQLAPRFERQLFIVRGGSMEPAIPLGALIATRAVPPADLRLGDIVTMRGEGNRVVTHRIVELVEEDGRIWLSTQGDASVAPDLERVPAEVVVGRVDAFVPLLGYVLAFISLPSGMLAVVALAGTLLLLRWTIEDAARRRPARREMPAVEGARRLAG